MTRNINLCAVNEATGWCRKCQIFLEKTPEDEDFFCAELAEEYLRVDPDSGEYSYD